MTKLSKFRFSTRKTDDIKIRINSHSDKVIIWGLVFVSCWLYFNLSNKDMTDFIYLCSLLWYLIVLLYICRIRIFSGLGIYICYFFCYVPLWKGTITYPTTVFKEPLNIFVLNVRMTVPAHNIVKIKRRYLLGKVNFSPFLFMIGLIYPFLQSHHMPQIYSYRL